MDCQGRAVEECRGVEGSGSVGKGSAVKAGRYEDWSATEKYVGAVEVRNGRVKLGGAGQLCRGRTGVERKGKE